MSPSFGNVCRVAACLLLALGMGQPALGQPPANGSQTRSAKASEPRETRAGEKDCSSATPLPQDTAITPVGADVPTAVAGFSGGWQGSWRNRTSADGPCTTLVVEEVLANGYARVVYSIGAFDPYVLLPRYWRLSGRVVDGVLSFTLPAPMRAEYTFRVAGSGLAGSYKDDTAEAAVAVRPIADLQRVGCPAVPAAAQPIGNTRDRILASELLASWFGAGTTHNDYFMPIGITAPARHSLRGKLSVPALKLSSALKGCAGLPSPSPAFVLVFFTHGDHLVPVTRTVIWSSDRRFGIILFPGRIWSEPGDEGLSRASFPFPIVNPIDNGTCISSPRVNLVTETTRIFTSISLTAPPRHTIRTWTTSCSPRSRTTFSTRQRSNALRLASVVLGSVQISGRRPDKRMTLSLSALTTATGDRLRRRFSGQSVLRSSDLVQGGLPAALQLSGNEAIVGIDAVELSLSKRSLVATAR